MEPQAKRLITRADILDPVQYAAVRAEKKRALVALKRARQVPVGPDAMVTFECYDTVWMLIQEMLHIEKGGEAQIADELRAYAPLVPNGHELVATLMFEIDEPLRRAAVLGRLGGVETTISLHVGAERVRARPETDIERTSADGKTSAVHFLHFPLNPTQRANLATPQTPHTPLLLGITHPHYGHLAILSETTRRALAQDLD